MKRRKRHGRVEAPVQSRFQNAASQEQHPDLASEHPQNPLDRFPLREQPAQGDQGLPGIPGTHGIGQVEDARLAGGAQHRHDVRRADVRTRPNVEEDLLDLRLQTANTEPRAVHDGGHRPRLDGLLGSLHHPPDLVPCHVRVHLGLSRFSCPHAAVNDEPELADPLEE